jgi:hypothetical protein
MIDRQMMRVAAAPMPWKKRAVSRMPKVGDELVTELSCEGKELKGDRRWVRFGSETRRTDGELMFSGLMTTLWAK